MLFRCSFPPLFLLLVIAAGCSPRTNPSFPLTVVEARQAWGEMEQAPVRLDRPVVILSGYRDPGFVPHRLVPVMRRLTGDDRVIGLAYSFSRDFDDCQERVVRFVDENFPNEDPDLTTEVDVIAVSMGGLVARYAAGERPGNPDGRRLHIARLFTISTPHRGARLAELPTFNQLHSDMRRNSRFLSELNALDGEASYEMYSYVRLGDRTIGTRNAAPEGEKAWWVPNRFMQMPHSGAFDDPRILADIARRLRNERPFTTSPPAPFP